MRVRESHEPRVLGRTMRGEGYEGHGAIRVPGHALAAAPYDCSSAMCGTGPASAAGTGVVQSLALPLAPDVRCAEKEVRSWA
jgi:hypothetical protein